MKIIRVLLTTVIEQYEQHPWRLLAVLVFFSATLLSLILSSLLFNGSFLAKEYVPPSLEAVLGYVSRGDSAFKGHSYGKALYLYSFALHGLSKLKELDARRKALGEDSQSYEYLEASIEARLTLAELGTRIQHTRGQKDGRIMGAPNFRAAPDNYAPVSPNKVGRHGKPN
jgi:hypothetical protein